MVKYFDLGKASVLFLHKKLKKAVLPVEDFLLRRGCKRNKNQAELLPGMNLTLA